MTNMMKTVIAGAFALATLSAAHNALAQNKPVWADTTSKVTLGATANTADDADRLVIAQLKEQGSDITKPTDVIFYLYFPTQADAESLRATVADMGFTVDIHQIDGYTDWTLAANKTMIPSEDNILPLNHKFDDLAASKNGTYDGWEAALVK